MFHGNGNILEKSGNLDFLMNELVLGAVNQVGNPAEGLQIESHLMGPQHALHEMEGIVASVVNPQASSRPASPSLGPSPLTLDTKTHPSLGKPKNTKASLKWKRRARVGAFQLTPF